jgi:hypothetical protein
VQWMSRVEERRRQRRRWPAPRRRPADRGCPPVYPVVSPGKPIPPTCAPSNPPAICSMGNYSYSCRKIRVGEEKFKVVAGCACKQGSMASYKYGKDLGSEF